MNSEKAWVLGYLLSDGCINRPTYRKKGDETHLTFICKYSDREILTKVKRILKTRSIIHDYPNYTSPQSKIEIYDRKDIIEKYNDIKERIPEKSIVGYERDFIRGLIDGDGTLSYRVNRKIFRIGYINEHKHIVQWVADTISKALLVPQRTARWVPQNNIWEILWEGNVARLIAYWLYHGNTSSCCLERKRKKYVDIVLNGISLTDNIDLIRAVKGTLDEKGEIAFRLPSTQSLVWCKRVQSLLSFNTVPLFHNKGRKKYYKLYIPDKNLVANMRDALTKVEVKA